MCVAATFQSELDITNITHRFLKFVITKFPLLNVSQLQDLQAKDTYFEPIIAKCKLIDLIWVKKENVSFHFTKSIPIRRFESPVVGPSFQLCIPKVREMNNIRAEMLKLSLVFFSKEAIFYISILVLQILKSILSPRYMV